MTQTDGGVALTVAPLTSGHADRGACVKSRPAGDPGYYEGLPPTLDQEARNFPVYQHIERLLAGLIAIVKMRS